MSIRIKLRRGTSAEWTAANTVLLLGEQGFETDTNRIKIGDGTTSWNSLKYVDEFYVTINPLLLIGA